MDKMTWYEKFFRTLEEHSTGALDAVGFRQLGPLSEHHGSWKATYFQATKGLKRFVSLSLAYSDHPEGIGPAIHLHAHIGAEGQRKRRSEPIYHRDIPVPEPLDDAARNAEIAWLISQLTEGAGQVSLWNERDLSDEQLPRAADL